MSPQPIYSADNVRPAYQLDWSLTVFWRESIWSADWFPALQQSLEPDGIRLLNHRFSRSDISLFLVSTTPDVLPMEIPRRVKGRLQHLLRQHGPKPFQRNYDLHSIGSTTREKLEAYLESQLAHHPEQHRDVHRMLLDLQVIRPEVDLSQPRFTSHGRYCCNLHLVLVNDWRRRETNPETLGRIRKMLILSAAAKSHVMSHAAILPDHIHMLFGTALNESPLSVALAAMNNVAFVYGMQPVLKPSCFMGTFGEYDLGAVQ